MSGSHGKSLTRPSTSVVRENRIDEQVVQDSAKFVASYEKTRTSVVEIPPDALQGAPDEPVPVLWVLTGSAQGEMRVLAAPVRVGRSPDTDLPIRDHGVSWEHCLFEPVGDGGVRVTDLGSTNGTWLGSERIAAPVLLEPGARIRIGAGTVLRLTVEDPDEVEVHAELVEAALTDHLTGLFNQRYFVRRLTAEFEFARRQSRHLSLVFLDLDHFKRINDTYGHPAGDAVLRAVGGLLKKRSRIEDICCRYGGEEFAVICRETHPTRALVLAERLRGALEDMRVQAGPRQLRVTGSFGVAGICPTGDSKITDLVAACDEALYRAKHEGRNRVAPAVECL